jgi:hypothetical protein
VPPRPVPTRGASLEQLVGSDEAERVRHRENEVRKKLGWEALLLPTEVAAKKEYRRQVAGTYVDTSALYAQYRAEQSHARQVRTGEGAALRGRQRVEEEALWASNAAQRSALKHLGVDPVAKRLLYALAKRALKASLAELRDKHRRERVLLSRRTPRVQWVEWLQMKAVAGQENALEILRARAFRDELFREATPRSSISASGRPSGAPLGLPIAAVSKKGTVLFQAGATAIRDDGASLQVSKEADLGGIHLALRIAERRYGHRLTVNGSPEFKARVVASAAAQRLQVTFVDKDLERRHQALLTLRNGMPNGRKDGIRNCWRKRWRWVSSEAPGEIQEDLEDRKAQTQVPLASNEEVPLQETRAEVGAVAQTNTLSELSVLPPMPPLSGPLPIGDQALQPADEPAEPPTEGSPTLEAIAGEPPAFRKNRLRDLSELGVVLLEGSGPVLLPGDVPRDVEQSPTEGAAALRRPVSRRGVIVGGGEAAAKYIAERAEKRALGFDIPEN